MRFTRLLALLVITLAAAPAFARNVYFNGVRLEDNVILTNQTFQACEVKFDEKGNVWITAKGFKVQVTTADGKEAKPPADEPEAPPADAKLTKRYWLVTPQLKKGAVQYDIDVYVNGTWVKKVRSTDDKVVMEVTKHIRPGQNKVHIVATKNMGDKRASSSATDVMEIVLGEGDVGGGTVMISKPLVTYKRNAQETQNFTDDFAITGR